MPSRFLYALLALATLAVLAGLTLHGEMRLVVWIFLGGLALKIWIAQLRKQQEELGDQDNG